MIRRARVWASEELDLFRENARRFFERECVPHLAKWRGQHFADRDIWTRAGAAGILCASMPEEYGGGGGNFLHEAVICEEQTSSLAQCFSNNVHSGIVAHYLLAYGSEPQKHRWLPRMATGELVAAIAMTEPGAGTDLQRIRTMATREGDAWRIRGSKTFITNGLHAGLVCVAAKTDQQGGARSISLFMVETNGTAGFRRGPALDKLGQRSQDTCEIFFDDVRIPADNLLGETEGRGFAQLMEQLPRERLLIAVGAVASMRRALDETLRYVRERQVFGASLLALQNTRFKLAECETQYQVTRAFVDECIARLLAGELDVAAAAMAKWWATDTCCRVVDECLQLHGGYGFMNEYPIAVMYADVRVGRIYGGANEVMKELVARSMERQ
ncbi:MAG TPA: acyl-CoA dehydrogenase family protein [Burkholderiaceae bacterium]|nr:acyl-CoA dehydrogenase family protein [Burkholderiaceae bacterium]